MVKGTGQSFALMYLTFANKDMKPEQVTNTSTASWCRASPRSKASAPPTSSAGATTRCASGSIRSRLAARNLTAGDVVAAIRASNFLSTPGKTQNEYVATSLEMQTTLQTA